MTALARSVAALLLLASAAAGGEIRVMASGGFTEPYNAVVPEYERKTQDKVLTVYGASMGGAPDSIPMRLQRGEPADVLIMASTALDALIQQGKVVPGSRVDLVRSKIGMSVRAGAPKPDIRTVEGLRKALLNAKSIAYSASASGTYLASELFPRLGIWEQIKGKSKRIESERVAAVVARGEAEIGFQQVSELLPVPGADFVGPLPEEVQLVTTFSAGIVAGAKNPAGAKALIEFLASPAAIPAIRKSGLEPVASE
ncbi:MAG TPA: substrate-binding domain-containing protein [Terriglobia bacterium]|nr:substrate-binding domain-containing protein [Terriglobia bacterium]